MTPREQEFLGALRRLTIDGVPPSYQELADELGLKSKSNINRLVSQLEGQGVIVRERYGPRSSIVVADGVSPAVLEALTPAAKRNTIARLAGMLGLQDGHVATAKMLRNIANTLDPPR